MGKSKCEQKKFEESRKIYTHVLERQTRVHGEDHPLVFTALNCLADLQNQEGKYDDAMRSYLSLLVRTQKVLGENHVLVLQPLTGVAAVLERQKKFGKAKDAYEALIAKQKITIKDVDERSVNALNCLASCFTHLGDLEGALGIFREVLGRQIKLSGDVHPSALAARSNVAVALANLKRFEEAAVLLKEARDVALENGDQRFLMGSVAAWTEVDRQAQEQREERIKREVAEARRKKIQKDREEKMYKAPEPTKEDRDRAEAVAAALLADLELDEKKDKKKGGGGQKAKKK